MAEKISPRVIAGTTLVELGEKNPNVLMINVDLCHPQCGMEFRDKLPDQTLEIGIAEQNAISVSAGLAKEGYIPFVFTFCPFMTLRAAEQIRTDVCYGNLPVVMMGSGAGYSNGISGVTHCGLEDCAVTTSFANLTVLEPSDPYMIAKMMEAAIEMKSPVYIRFSTEKVAILYGGEDYEYEVGKAIVAREGDDAAIIASGSRVAEAIEAADKLKEEKGISVRVVDMHTIKPIDREAVISAAGTGKIVCVQDHSIIGGLGSAVCQVVAEEGIGCKVKILGCPDKYVPLATPPFLYHENEMDAEGIEKNILKLM